LSEADQFFDMLDWGREPVSGRQRGTTIWSVSYCHSFQQFADRSNSLGMSIGFIR